MARPAKPPTPEKQYAIDLGIRLRALRAVGGMEKLKKLSPEVVAILTKPYKGVTGCAFRAGGLAARGMRERVPGIMREEFNDPALHTTEADGDQEEAVEAAPGRADKGGEGCTTSKSLRA